MASPLNADQAPHRPQDIEMVACMQDQLQHCSHSLDNRHRYAPTIFRVPSGIRHVKEAFEPEVISLGPYHYGSSGLKAMQDHKWWYLSKLISRNPLKGLSDYFEEIKLSIDKARKCYSEKIEMDDDHFAQILLLDGSFIVELLLLLWDRKPSPSSSPDGSKEEPFDHIRDTNWMILFLVKDMFKIENQVPFFILQIIYKLVALRPEGEPSIEPSSITKLVFLFVAWCTQMDAGIKMMKMPSPDEEIHHLLHFYHSCFFAGRCKPFEGPAQFTIPTAKELREAGVKFRKKEEGGFLEATFSQGVIEMTPVFIHDNFGTIFHNLLAFEQCYTQAGTYVTGYSLFLDCLVDTVTDVLLLRQAGVVKSWLGSDKDLAHQVNRLCYNLVVSIIPDPIGALFLNVNNYRQSRWPRWRATLVHDYFSNPWAIISFFGVIILLLLTGLQTVFTILSYHQFPSEK